jgi:hypothetical protein
MAADVLQTRCIQLMKNPAAPPAEVESPLEDARLHEEGQFRRRGREAIERTIETGSGIPAGEIIANLQAKVDAARQRRAQPAKTVP